MVLRGGYGIFYQQTDRYGSESQLGLNLPQLVDASITRQLGDRRAGVHLRAGLHAARRRDRRTRRSCSGASRIPNQDTPIVQQFSIGPEFQFAREHGRRGRVRRQPHAQRPAAAQPERRASSADGSAVTFPYAQYGYGNAYLEQIVTNGRADYNALQMRMQRRMSGGLGLHGGLHLEQGAGRLPRSPERRRRRHRQRAGIDLRDGARTTARSPSTSRTAS